VNEAVQNTCLVAVSREPVCFQIIHHEKLYGIFFITDRKLLKQGSSAKSTSRCVQ
jgi:hypothetical protein